MRAVRLTTEGDAFRFDVREQAVPYPGPGQVLVRVGAAPLHAADVALARGRWGTRRPLPTTPGMEGVGEIVSSGGGLVSRFLVGRRVAFLTRPDTDGSWAEYVVTDAHRCVPVGPGVIDAEAATALHTPLTALALMDAVRAHGGGGLVVTAGAGALGRALVRLGRRERLAVVPIVRRAGQAELLQADGASEVLLADDPELDARIRRATRAFRITAAVDAVGGPFTGRLLSALPDGGLVIVHGALDDRPSQLHVADLAWRRSALRGFWLHDHLSRQGATALAQAWPRLRRHAVELKTEIREQVRLADVPDAVARYAAEMTRGRALIIPT